MKHLISVFRFFAVFHGFFILPHLDMAGQALFQESPEIEGLSDRFYFGGNATVGIGFWSGRARTLFAAPFLAKGGLSLVWDHWSFEADGYFLNGRQKTDFQLAGMDFRKNDRYTVIGAQTFVGYWIPVSNQMWVQPSAGLSYQYLMPGITEFTEGETQVRGTLGCPGAGIFIGRMIQKRKGEADAPHLEWIGLRYEIIWPGFTDISGVIHHIGLSISGLLSR